MMIHILFATVTAAQISNQTTDRKIQFGRWITASPLENEENAKLRARRLSIFAKGKTLPSVEIVKRYKVALTQAQGSPTQMNVVTCSAWIETLSLDTKPTLPRIGDTSSLARMFLKVPATPTLEIQRSAQVVDLSNDALPGDWISIRWQVQTDRLLKEPDLSPVLLKRMSLYAGSWPYKARKDTSRRIYDKWRVRVSQDPSATNLYFAVWIGYSSVQDRSDLKFLEGIKTLDRQLRRVAGAEPFGAAYAGHLQYAKRVAILRSTGVDIGTKG